jgi:lipopolysaccharide transport system permease protein
MTGHSSTSATRLLILEKGVADRTYWRDLWDYRELFWILAWRDVAVRYKQAVLGIGWAILRPAITVLVFTIVFGRLANLPSDGSVPYPLMVMAGMLPWFVFSTILNEASNSVVGNSALISKVYFPRVIIPASSALAAMVDFFISLMMMFALMGWYGFMPSWRILLLPLLVTHVLATSLGPALFFAALNVKYRDFRYIIPFLLQIGLYISPVGFSSAVVPESWRMWYSFNPMVGVIDAFRWCLLGHDTSLYMPGLIISILTAWASLWFGLVYFRRTEKQFADII